MNNNEEFGKSSGYAILWYSPNDAPPLLGEVIYDSKKEAEGVITVLMRNGMDFAQRGGEVFYMTRVSRITPEAARERDEILVKIEQLERRIARLMGEA